MIKFTHEEYTAFLGSNEVKKWQKSVESLLDHIIDLMDKKVDVEKKYEIQSEIIANIFVSSIILHNAIERVKNEEK